MTFIPVSSIYSQFESKIPYLMFERHYNHSTRFYHNISHIEQMFDELYKRVLSFDSRNHENGFFAPLIKLDELELAILFHDIIYETSESEYENNELNSAKVFKENVQFGNSDYVYNMIRGSKKHDPTGDITIDLFYDLDFSIFCSKFDTYLKYASNVRKEFSWVSDDLWIKGRKNFIKSLNGRKIFNTCFFTNEDEEQALVNISKELYALERGDIL